MAEVGLQLNPAKTRIVYCKDGRRRLDYEHTAFTFLGFTFRARGGAERNGVNFTGFLPAVSKDALNKMSREVRRWRLHLLTGHTLADLARKINPIVRGWMRYYGAFYRTVLDPLLGPHQRLPDALDPPEVSTAAALPRRPWPAGNASPANSRGSLPTGHGRPHPGDQDDKSRVTGDCHARIRGSRGAKLPPATRHPSPTPRSYIAATSSAA